MLREGGGKGGREGRRVRCDVCTRQSVCDLLVWALGLSHVALDVEEGDAEEGREGGREGGRKGGMSKRSRERESKRG